MDPLLHVFPLCHPDRHRLGASMMCWFVNFGMLLVIHDSWVMINHLIYVICTLAYLHPCSALSFSTRPIYPLPHTCKLFNTTQSRGACINEKMRRTIFFKTLQSLILCSGWTSSPLNTIMVSVRFIYGVHLVNASIRLAQRWTHLITYVSFASKLSRIRCTVLLRRYYRPLCRVVIV